MTGGYCKERTKKERVLCIYVQRVLSLHPQFFQSSPTNKASLLGPDEKARSMGEAGHLCAKELLGEGALPRGQAASPGSVPGGGRVL